MKYFVLFGLLLVGGSCLSQSEPSRHAQGTASGTIYIPTLQSINIEMQHSGMIEFNKAEDFDMGKLIPNFIRATVISNVPYIISVMSGDAGLTSVGETPQMPISVISLKESFSSQFVNLASQSRSLLISKSNLVTSVYNIDAHFNPGWNYSGGEYATTLVFTLTAQ